MKQLIFVFVGGGVGSVLRFAVAKYLAAYSVHFPIATLCANVLACLLLGIVAGSAGRGAVSESARLLLIVGICGGFSTFSTFSGETLQLLQTGRYGIAALYVCGSLGACVGGVALGLRLATLLPRF